MQDRHLHQLVMCVIFGACKIEGDNEVTFKKIIAEHRFAFETGEQVCLCMFPDTKIQEDDVKREWQQEKENQIALHQRLANRRDLTY